MKKLIIILLLFSTTQAATKKSLKTKLDKCQILTIQLDSLLRSQKEVVNILPPTTRKDVKLAQIEAKRDIRTTQIESKVTIKTDWFKNLMNNITKVVALLTLVGTAGVGAFLKTIFDKFMN